mgnify:CR=1 FL=1
MARHVETLGGPLAPLGLDRSRPIAAQGPMLPKTLRKGDYGEEVTKLQKLLPNAGSRSNPVTGYFGSDTEKVVKAFQKDVNLPKTGVVGPETWTVLLRSAAATHVSAAPGFSLRHGALRPGVLRPGPVIAPEAMPVAEAGIAPSRTPLLVLGGALVIGAAAYFISKRPKKGRT